MVFVSTVAILDAWMAQRNRRSENVLSDFGARYCPRHYFSVGFADGDDGDEVYREGTICGRLCDGHDPRQPGAADVQDQDEWRRSSRGL